MKNSKNISKIITPRKNNRYPLYPYQNNQYKDIDKIETLNQIETIKTIQPFNYSNQKFQSQMHFSNEYENNNIKNINKNYYNNLNISDIPYKENKNNKDNFIEAQINKIITRDNDKIEKIETIYPKEKNYIITRNPDNNQQENNALLSNSNNQNNQSQISLNNNNEEISEYTYIHLPNDNTFSNISFDFDSNNQINNESINNNCNIQNLFQPRFSLYGQPMNLAAYNLLNQSQK